MRVLTVRQPWASAIVFEGKSPENRSQLWHYTGPVAIHAAAAVDQAGFDHPAIVATMGAAAKLGFGAPATLARPLHTSAVLGVVQMIGAHPAEDDCCPGNVWAERGLGVVHLVVRNPRPFLEPIHGVTGRLGLWKPDNDLLHQIGDRLVATVVDRTADRILGVTP